MQEFFLAVVHDQFDSMESFVEIASQEELNEAFHIACTNFRIKIARFLLDAGANPDGETLEFVLHNAVDLVYEFNDVVAPFNNKQILMALPRLKLSLVKKLLNNGFNVNCIDRSATTTPLLEALHGGRPDLVELFVARGADVNNQPTAYNDNPLLIAICRGDAKSVEALLKAGAESNETHVRCALDGYQERILAMLIEDFT